MKSEDIWNVWKTMYSVAKQKQFRLSDDDARDLATEQLISLLELFSAGYDVALSSRYAAKCVKNRILEKKRQQKIRVFHSLDEMPSEWWQFFAQPPSQLHAVELSDVLTAIEKLPDVKSRIIIKSALGVETSALAKEIGLSADAVSRMLHDLRKFLKGGADDDIVRRKNFIGVKKQRRKFSASIKIAGEWTYLGLFDTAEDAARAYDAEALKLGRTTLNFPQAA